MVGNLDSVGRVISNTEWDVHIPADDAASGLSVVRCTPLPSHTSNRAHIFDGARANMHDLVSATPIAIL